MGAGNWTWVFWKYRSTHFEAGFHYVTLAAPPPQSAGTNSMQALLTNELSLKDFTRLWKSVFILLKSNLNKTFSLNKGIMSVDPSIINVKCPW